MFPIVEQSMFTGLVEAVGEVVAIEAQGKSARLEIALPFAPELALGDSVAINGCCLTVAALAPHGASFDLLAQTLRITSLGELAHGSKVNLERALLPTSRLGGHFVQGHVDATGEIIALTPDGQDFCLKIALPTTIHRYCIDKGSIAIDGISLTIAELDPIHATFWITPHTMANTHLHQKASGQKVNLEADLLAKYTEKLLQAPH